MYVISSLNLKSPKATLASLSPSKWPRECRCRRQNSRNDYLISLSRLFIQFLTIQALMIFEKGLHAILGSCMTVWVSINTHNVTTKCSGILQCIQTLRTSIETSCPHYLKKGGCEHALVLSDRSFLRLHHLARHLMLSTLSIRLRCIGVCPE